MSTFFVLRTAFSSHRHLVCNVGQVSTWVSQRALMLLHEQLMEMGFSLYTVSPYTVFTEWIMPIKGGMDIRKK
jgi:hypothetical protein